MLQDIRYALRTFRREPGFVLVAVLTLGSAIGVNTSVFAAFHALMWRPWPVPDPDRVVTVVNARTQADFTLAEYQQFVERSTSFTGLVATRCIDGISEGCSVRDPHDDLAASFVSGNFFQVLRIGVEHGRAFQPDDDRRDAPRAVLILNYETWRRRFGADPQIVGREIRVDEVPFTVIGVAARDFRGTGLERRDVWIPLSAIALLRPKAVLDDATRRAAISGRLADGVSVDQARAELAVISRQYRLAHGIEPSGLELIDTTYFTNPARRKSGLPILGLMLGAVLTVLLLACANVGNLLLARAAARRREIAVRLAIGATRRRIVRQLVTESLILAGASAAGGIATSYVLPLYILGWLADPLAVPLEPDTTILAYTAALVIVTCLASGVAPALHATRGSLTEALAGRDRLPGTRLSLGGALMAVQVAAALVIVLNGMLLVRSVQHLAARDLGFAMDDVMVASFELPPAYDAARVRAFAAQVLNEAPGALGGARIAFASTVPFAPGARPTTMFRLPGGSAVNHEALAIDVSREYFDLLRVPLVAGRLFDASDSGRDVILINESLARRFFPGGTPLGQTLAAGAPRQIVGIVKDMHTYPGNLDIALPTIYAPIGAHAMPQILIRAAGRAAAPRLAAFAADIDPRARIRVVPLSSGFDKVVMRSTVGAGIATLLGALALMFAAVGLFSVCAHVVQQRTREIGIRMALGARGSHVMALLFAANGRAIALGIAIGLPSAVAGSLAMRGVLYGLSSADPVAYFTASGLLVIAAAAATFIPARRALRVDPMTALRCD